MKRASLALGLLALLGIALRCAWLGDDAFITLRTVDNFVHGHGLRWNVVERVQAYTHPLWMFLLVPIYAITREGLYTLSLTSLAVAAIAYAVLAAPRGVLLPLLLCCSRTIVSFTTSGLEGPLALLLLALLLRRRGRATVHDVLLVSLLALTRIDLVLVGAPLLAARRPTLRALALGALPFVAWELFSLVYYGALVPNTAYAKLQTGISHAVLAEQGLRYVETLGMWDPGGALLLVVGTGVALVRRRALGLGLVAYALYVVWIGGDFMAGRFFYVPIALAATCVCELPGAWLALPGMVLLVWLPTWLGLVQPPLEWARLEGKMFSRWAVADERLGWGPRTGLFAATRARPFEDDPIHEQAMQLRPSGVAPAVAIGLFGYWAGPGPYIIDTVGLSDPLLARLPVRDVHVFRVGHYQRAMPLGYISSVRSSKPHVDDPDLDAYYQYLVAATRAPIWSMARVRAIAMLLSGRAEPLRQAYIATYRAAQAARPK